MTFLNLHQNLVVRVLSEIDSQVRKARQLLPSEFLLKVKKARILGGLITLVRSLHKFLKQIMRSVSTAVAIVFYSMNLFDCVLFGTEINLSAVSPPIILFEKIRWLEIDGSTPLMENFRLKSMKASPLRLKSGYLLLGDDHYDFFFNGKLRWEKIRAENCRILCHIFQVKDWCRVNDFTRKKYRRKKSQTGLKMQRRIGNDLQRFSWKFVSL